MMLRRVALLLPFLILSVVAAQEDTPLPVLNPDEIFLDGITILEHLPVLTYDNSTREIDYFDPEVQQWETIPYPEEVDQFFAIADTPTAEGTFYVLTYPPYLPYHTDLDSIWVFDPAQNAITHPENPTTACGVHPIDTHVVGFELEEWIIDETQQALCNLISGETIPLPDELADTPASYPDWMNFPRLNTYSSERYIYIRGEDVYDIETGEWRSIGRIPVSYHYLDVTFDGDLMILLAHGAFIGGLDGPATDKSNLLVANASEDESVRHIAELPFRYRGTPYTSDGNGRLLWAESRGDYFSILAYDITTYGTTILVESGTFRQEIQSFGDSFDAVPTSLSINPENPDLIAFSFGIGQNYVIRETNDELISVAGNFLSWHDANRYLTISSNPQIYLDCYIPADSSGASCLDWLTPRLGVNPRLSLDQRYMLVMPFGDTYPRDEVQVVDMETRTELDGIAAFSLPNRASMNMTWYWQEDYSLLAEVSVEDEIRGRFRIRLDVLNERTS